MENINVDNRIDTVDYTLEEAYAVLDDMIATTLSEFDSACDKIDKEYAQSNISATNAAEE